MRLISGSMLYDVVQCPYRVYMDVHGDRSLKEEPGEFLKLLWEQGFAHEKEVVQSLAPGATDLSHLSGDEKEQATWEAIDRGDAIIYSGRLTFEDLVGEPDLLRGTGSAYLPGDIKSGSADADEESGRYKKHYAMQLAHYAHIVRSLGLSAGSPKGFIVDRASRELAYDLTIAQNTRTTKSWWDEYLQLLASIRAMLSGREMPTPAMAAACKLCEWQSECTRQLKESDDLTLIPELGRSKRDVMQQLVPTVAALANADVQSFVSGKRTIFAGVGPESLVKFQTRAKLLTTPNSTPFAKLPITLPQSWPRAFFDVEVDPMRDLCYLHGLLIVRNDHDEGEFIGCYADEPTAASEREAFAQALHSIRLLPPEASIYHYSKYERTTWRALQQKYPDLASADEVELIFGASRAVDLLDIVRRCTEWPTNDHSIKTLAKYLGFSWRDTDPSGASSIGWYHEWTSTREVRVKQRILDYNEDDCRATLVLLEGLRALKLSTAG